MGSCWMLSDPGLYFLKFPGTLKNTVSKKHTYSCEEGTGIPSRRREEHGGSFVISMCVHYM